MNTSGDSNITTGSISGSGQTSYVSCIKVNGRPILPPIMSESLREEMRRYREEAIKVETTLKFKQRLHVHLHPPTRLSQVPMNTTVTLSPHKDNPNIPNPHPPDSDSADSLINKPSSPIPIPAISPSHSNNLASSSETTENKNAFDMLSDHFSIKKHTHSQASQIPAFPSSDEESISSDSFVSEGSSHLNPSVTYIKLEDEHSPIEPPPFFQDPPKDSPKEEDYQSEAMSLISLDNEERLEREEFQKEREEEEEGSIHVSGRSSTETYTIEKNNYSSDSENNNETNFNSINSTRNYFFSPIHSRAEDTEEIVFNSENADTVKSKKETRSYFSSPQQSPTTPDNNEVSVISSVASQPSTTDSFLSPKSTLSASSKGSSSVRKRFYFSSPESDEDPSKGSLSTESNPVRTLNTNFANLDFKSFEASTAEPKGSQRSNLLELDSKSPDVFSSGEPKKSENVTVDYKSMLPTRIPSPKKTPLTPTKVNLMPELQSLVISPKMLEDQREKRGKTPRSPVKKCRNESVQERTFKGSLSLGQVNLSTLQTTLQNMSPSVFKVPSDARSPLLKGVVFMDPLFRPKRELRIPPEVNDPGMQGKFARATAAGKGFLVRRLLKTEKLQMIIQTIRDTVELVLKLYEEVPQLKVRGWKGVNAEDADLCRRLFQQLTGACASFHDVFFKLTTPQRMAIIASDREKMKAKEMKNFLSRSARPTRGPSSKPPRSGNSNLSKRKISTATVKCLERRMSALHS